VEALKRVFELAEGSGAERFVFSSTYSNYGLAPDGAPVHEDSPLYPQSLYAETKIAAEQYLQQQEAHARCVPIISAYPLRPDRQPVRVRGAEP
jgi:nucleoside-diphosphate-sugar epimerase